MPTGAFRMTFTSATDATRPPVIAVVSRAIGSRRYQQYLTRIGDAEYRLPVAFHVGDRRWFHMNGAFPFADPQPAGDRTRRRRSSPVRRPAAGSLATFVAGLARLGGSEYARHVTRWNDNCVFCHNVAPNPGRDPATGRFRTEVAEMGIACEACHGPGAAHASANRDPVRRYSLHLGAGGDPTIVNPSRLSPARAADLCGRCHGQRITDDIARFIDHGDPFVPGDDLALWSAPLWQETPLGAERAPFAPRFWADGTARLTAYEYQGLLQSPCTQRGTLTCTSCHGMHDGDPRGQLRPAATGDGACTGCHRQLAGAAAQAKHSHHLAASGTASGAGCVDCHMPRIVYGDPRPAPQPPHRGPRSGARGGARPSRRLHRMPRRRDAGLGGGRRAAALGGRRRDQERPGRERPAGGAGDDAAGGEGPLAKILSGDPIERAVAADALGRSRVPAGPDARAVRVGRLLEVMAGDDYPAVRYLAARALGQLWPAPALASPLAGYDPNGAAGDRQRAVAQLRASLPAARGRRARAGAGAPLARRGHRGRHRDRRMTDLVEPARSRRFAWSSLFVWVLFGLALEAAHGFKLSAYLDDSLRRSLLRLAHAHGVILALVVLAWGEAGAPLVDPPARAPGVGRWLRAGAALVPLGFALSAVRATEADPSLPIVLVPLGALALLAALGRTAHGAWRRRR